jgi:hypothetical protein
MKKIILGISVLSLVMLAFGFYLTSAHADDRQNNRGHGNDNNHNSGKFNADQQLSKSACGENLDKPVINVTQKVQNDVDSGFGGYWAFDYYTRHITVWKTGSPAESTYCATVVYDGQFYAVPGQVSPGASGGLINTSTNAPVNGDMTGGKRVTFTGTLLTTPTTGWPNFGTVTPVSNYQCDINNVCPGFNALFPTNSSWVVKYFSGSPVSTNLAWWGWKYNGGSHGTWINECANNATDTVPASNASCLGSSGNIL